MPRIVRKQYPEDPAEFKALTEDELLRIKKERRHKDLQRKQKAAESRKHLANVRVVQRNLVFVVGLSPRLADVDVLKKHEYFGKFGKMHKVVINQNTSYAGSQGPSASAYVTYIKPEDALKAIQSVNNVHVDGRTLKASLGTTKYCSHFLRGTQCPKPDCMYLHELGEEAASFTKEEMQQGKHTEYEQKLYEQYMNSQNLSNQQTQQQSGRSQTKRKTGSPTMQQQSKPLPVPSSSPSPPQNGKEIWSSDSPSSSSSSSSSSASLPGSKPDRGAERCVGKGSQSNFKPDSHSSQQKAPGHQRSAHTPPNNSKPKESSQMNGHVGRQAGCPSSHNGHSKVPSPAPTPPAGLSGLSMGGAAAGSMMPPSNCEPPPHLLPPHPAPHTVSHPHPCFDNSNSLFSSNGFAGARRPPPPQLVEESLPVTTEIPETIPVSSSTDWQAAFGFSSSPAIINNTGFRESPDDEDLGFDPWDESTKALADLIAKEASATAMQQLPGLMAPPLGGSLHNSLHIPPHLLSDHRQPPPVKPLPPGLGHGHSHLGAFHTNSMGLPGSKLLGMQFPAMVSSLPAAGAAGPYSDGFPDHITRPDASPSQDWQEGLRALLPSNINLSFGAASSNNGSQSHAQQQLPHQQQPHQQQLPHKPWATQSPADLPFDPAIVTSGHITDSMEEPHWMASLHHLTEEPSRPYVAPQPSMSRAAPCWPSSAATAMLPPPGFHQPPLRATPQQVLTAAPDTHKLDGLQ